MRFAFMLTGVWFAFAAMPAQAEEPAKGKPAPTLQEDLKALQGGWYKVPAEGAGKDTPRLIMQFSDKNVLVQVENKVDGFTAFGKAAFELKEKNQRRLIEVTQKQPFISMPEVFYSLEGDKLALDGGQFKAVKAYELKGDWRRIKD